MNNNNLTSCIIIFFNESKFLEEAIRSVLNQTCRHWELLLIDDGSSDQSTEIAKEYSKKYPERIFYYDHEHHRNRGMSASRNLGISKSRGEYIAFLDADDIWLPEKLEQQIKILITHPEAAMVYGKALVWYSWTGNADTKDADYFYDLGVCPDKLYQPPELFCLLVRNQAQTPMTSNALLRKKVFDIVGGFEEYFKAMYEDQVFFSKVNLNFRVYVSGKCWIRYRQHDKSCTSIASKINYWKQRRPFLNWLYSYLFNNGFSNTRMMKAVKRELRLSFFPFVFKRYYVIKDKIKNLVYGI